MVRLTGPDESARLVYDAAKGTANRGGSIGRICTDLAMTTSANLLYANGQPVPIVSGAAEVVIDTTSKWPRLQYPDGNIDVLYGSVDGGDATPLPADFDSVYAQATGWLVATDGRWGSDPFGTNLKAALAAATAGQTVYIPEGTYTAPTGVGSGYTIVNSGVRVIAAPGVTINVATWGQAGIDCFNCSDITITGRLKVVYTGIRGNSLGTPYRGSAPYCNGTGVYINRDRCRIEGLRTVNMPVGAFLSSYNGTSSTDRAGVGNVIQDLEAEGANFGILWVGQQALRIDKVYVHDDIDDSSGGNPTHAYYASGAAALGASDISISNVVAENILGGQPFQLKYCTGTRLSNHVASNCKGLFDGIDLTDLQWTNMGGAGILANGGQGAVTFQKVTNICRRVSLNNTAIQYATGVDERIVRLDLADSEISDMLLVTSRPASPSNVSDYEVILTGNEVRLRGVTVRSRGAGHVRAFSLGSSTSTNLTVEDFLCEATVGLVDVTAGSTGIKVKYSPGLQQGIIAGSNYIASNGGAADYSVSRSEYERLVTVASGSTTPTPNPYLETRTNLNITDSSNVTIGAPLGGTPNVGTVLDVVVSNSSGGTLGTISWNVAYVLAGPYSKPASGAITQHRFRHNGSSWIEQSYSSPAVAALAGDTLSAGEIVPRRDVALVNTVAISSGLLHLSYLTASKTESITTITAATGGTAAAATPTLCRFGVYSVAANGDLTLIASTANDTTLFGATNTEYPKALQSSWNKVAGQRYALGLLVVSGTTTPTFHGLQHTQTNPVNTLSRLAPAVSGRVSGLADLPSSTAAGSIVGWQAVLSMWLS